MHKAIVPVPLLGPVLMGLILAASPAPAQGSCDIDLRRLDSVHWRAGPGRSYNPFSPEQYVQEEEFEVRHSGDACDFFVTFSEGHAGSFERKMYNNGGALEYNLYNSASLDAVLKDLPGAQANEVLQGRFDSDRDDDHWHDDQDDDDWRDDDDDDRWDRRRGDQPRRKGRQTQRLSFFVPITPLQIRPPGQYRDDLRVTLYEGTLADPIRRDERTLSIRTRIQPAVQVSIGRQGSPFDPQHTQQSLDFGELKEGEKGRAELLVRANTGYEIIMSSENRGTLRHIQDGESAVSYVFEFNGDMVNLRRPYSKVNVRGGPTDYTGDRHAINVTIGDIGGASAGRHRDAITFTVRAR